MVASLYRYRATTALGVPGEKECCHICQETGMNREETAECEQAGQASSLESEELDQRGHALGRSGDGQYGGKARGRVSVR